MNRRNFLGLLGGALVASTKSYSFLGGILRPRNGDSIIWNHSGGPVELSSYWVVETQIGGLNIVKAFKEGEHFQVEGQSLKCKLTTYQYIGEANLIRKDVTDEIFLHTGDTLKVVFRKPEIKPV